MTKLSRFTNFYLLEDIGLDYSSLMDKLHEDDFLFVDTTHIFYTTEEEETKLSEFLNILNSKGVNWLFFCFDFPLVRQLYSEYQICQFTEVNNFHSDEEKEHEFLFIFNCDPVDASKFFNLKGKSLETLSINVPFA